MDWVAVRGGSGGTYFKIFHIFGNPLHILDSFKYSISIVNGTAGKYIHVLEMQGKLWNLIIHIK